MLIYTFLLWTKRIVAVSKELEETEAIYEEKVEQFLQLEEEVESFINN